MPKNKSPIPVAPVKRLMAQATGFRISHAAAEELAAHTQSVAVKIAKRCIENAAHTERTTILPKDVRLASK
ncbi:MAG: histone H3/H4 [Candidatus Woesearchaeota archaeon]|jgi:histone H3/H4